MSDLDPPLPRLQTQAGEILARQDDAPAIRFEGRWRSWAEVRALARLVQALVARSGAPERAPVLFLARNVPEMLAALLGLIADGRSIRMLYAFQSSEAIAQAITRLKPAIVIGTAFDLGGEIPAAIGNGGGAAIALDEMAAAALPGLARSTAGLSANDPAESAIEIQTSGTTGPPKHFPVTYPKAHHHFVERLVAMKSGEDLRLPALLTMSLGNLSGMMGALPALLTGQEMLLYDRFSLEAWRNYVRTYRPAWSGIPPTTLPRLMELDVPGEELSSLRSLMIGSAPLDRRAHRAFEKRYGIPVLYSYGATEFYGTVASFTGELHAEWGESKFGSVGRAVPGVALRVVDPDSGATREPGIEGLIEVFSDAIAADWIRTSDLGVIDADGFLFIRGRADGAITRGGFKLAPEVIEQALLTHSAVAATCVVGVPDRRLGEVPAAAVRLLAGSPPVGRAELEAHLRRNLPATHIPALWCFPAELPKNVSLKVDRRAVRRFFTEDDGDA